MTLVNVGYGNMVACERIVAVIGSDTAPAKRLISEAKEDGRVIDVTCGKRTVSVIITDSDHIILSAFSTEALAARVAASGDNTGDTADAE